jgi:hypothetical protein
MKSLRKGSLVFVPVFILGLACSSIRAAKTITPGVTNTLQPPPTEIPIGKVGETIVQGGYILQVTNVETSKSVLPHDFIDKGKIFLAIELIIKSGADKDVDVNPLYAKIEDSEGHEYRNSIFRKEPSLMAQSDLPKGGMVRGWVTFEVPENAHGFILTYEPYVVFRATVRIQVDLGL